jgi:uncharacterized protein
MPDGKAAGIRCVQLSPDNQCLIFGQAVRPKVCNSFPPNTETCGSDNLEAMQILDALEKMTRVR